MATPLHNSADAGRDINITTTTGSASEGQALCFLVTHSDVSDLREREDVVMAPDPIARFVEDAQPTAGGTPRRDRRVVYGDGCISTLG